MGLNLYYKFCIWYEKFYIEICDYGINTFPLAMSRRRKCYSHRELAEKLVFGVERYKLCVRTVKHQEVRLRNDERMQTSGTFRWETGLGNIIHGVKRPLGLIRIFGCPPWNSCLKEWFTLSLPASQGAFYIVSDLHCTESRENWEGS